LSFGRKLLLVFALTVFLSVGAVTWIVSAVTRRAFEQANDNQTTALIAQFRREFSRRGEEIASRGGNHRQKRDRHPDGSCREPWFH